MHSQNLGPKTFSQMSAAAAVFLVYLSGIAGSAAGPADETALRNAYALFTQQKYAQSADAFEALIRTATPNARLYYYAAAANKSCNRIARAKQLCQYVIANFPTSAEAALAQKLVPDQPATSSSGVLTDGLPAGMKGKSLDELMQTEEGRKALKEALQKKSTGGASTALVSASSGAQTSKGLAPATNSAATATAIAVDGPDDITQFIGHPQCWFECSLAALSMLPRGQALLTSMIKPAGTPGTYIVRFPGDGVEYTVTPQKMEEARVRDKALWATIIHTAQLMKLRNASEVTIDGGLSCLTGKKAEKLFAGNSTEQTLKQFIAEAIKGHNPVVCLSTDDFGTSPELMEAEHAYTITDIDTTSGMVTLRNPHGANSRRFRLKTDPDHKEFEQLNDGIFKINISVFPKYFTQVARASI